MMKKRPLLQFVLLLIALLLESGCVQQQPIACPADAKLCPDGSYVARVPPLCEFPPCPVINCSIYSVDDCPSTCVICPSCEVCSSVRCQTEEFCTGIGFNKSWWEHVRPIQCQCPEGYIPDGTICNPNCYKSIPHCLMPSIPCNYT
jgi:hypothetical protein